MKKTLMTGRTAQDGSYLVEFLLEKGHEVHGIERHTNPSRIDPVLRLEKYTRFYQASTPEFYGFAQETPRHETTPFYHRSPYAVAGDAAPQMKAGDMIVRINLHYFRSVELETLLADPARG